MGFNNDPPTSKQLDFLEILGHRGRKPRTKAEASELIDRLKNENLGSARARYQQEMNQLQVGVSKTKPSGCFRIFRVLLLLSALVFGLFLYLAYSLMQDVGAPPKEVSAPNTPSSQTEAREQQVVIEPDFSENESADLVGGTTIQQEVPMSDEDVFLAPKENAAAAMRLWKDLSGQFSVTAKAVAIEQDSVVLEKENGQVVKVPISRLSENDQAYIESVTDSLPVR